MRNRVSGFSLRFATQVEFGESWKGRALSRELLPSLAHRALHIIEVFRLYPLEFDCARVKGLRSVYRFSGFGIATRRVVS